MSIPDYNDLLDRREMDEERRLELLPKCDECEDPITTECYFEFDNFKICGHCLIKNHRKWTDE